MPLSPELYTFYANLVRVIDGDTIVVNIDLGFSVWKLNEHVRLAYIDTPETRTKDLVEKAAGLKAKAHVEEMFSYSKKMVLQTEKDAGKFGRYIAIVLLPDVEGNFTINLNQKLLDEGLAELY